MEAPDVFRALGKRKPGFVRPNPEPRRQLEKEAKAPGASTGSVFSILPRSSVANNFFAGNRRCAISSGVKGLRIHPLQCRFEASPAYSGWSGKKVIFVCGRSTHRSSASSIPRKAPSMRAPAAKRVASSASKNQRSGYPAGYPGFPVAYGFADHKDLYRQAAAV